MAMPKQVEQQLKELEEMERALTVQPEELPPDPQPSQQPDKEAPTEPVVQKAEPEVKPEPPNDWEQKYKSLQGHFDREVPRLHQQNKELASQVQVLQQQVAELSKPKETVVEDRLVSDKDEEQFGSDLVDLQRRVAKEVMRDMVKPLQEELAKRDKEIADLTAKLGATNDGVTSLTFEQRLARAIPDFDEVNVDPKWIAWLGEVDEYTGKPRKEFAEYVYSVGNVEDLKRIVDLFKKQSLPPSDDRAQRQAELERQVTPSRTAATSSPSPGANRTYTEAEATKLFNKVREMNIAGKYDEAAKLEAELTQAYTQGRVR